MKIEGIYYYKITFINENSENMTIKKRYKDLKKLHKELTRNISKQQLGDLELPDKGKLGIFTTKNDPKLIEYRKLGLQSYMYSLINNANIRLHPIFKEFISSK